MTIDRYTAITSRLWPAQQLMALALCLLGASALEAGCSSQKSPGKHTTTSPPVVSRTVPSMNLDPQRTLRAKVVLRAERIAEHGGSKYHWGTVKPLRVLKNATKTRFTKPLRVAYYGWKPGLPAGVSTIYLEPYGDAASGHWRLLDGDGAVGVSHRTNR